MIKKYALVCIALLCSFFYGFGQTTIGIQDFEVTPATPTMTFTGGSVATGNGLFPSDPKYVSGSRGRQVSNTTTTILFSSVDASAYSSVYFASKLASFAGTSGNGSDGGDYVIVSVSTDGGTSWSQELEVNGNNNAKWSFSSGTGVASVTYDGDNSRTTFAPVAGGNRTTDGYSTITVTGLPNSSNLRVRLEVSNNSGNEYWVFDDAEILGTPVSTSDLSISGTPTDHGSLCVGTPGSPVTYTITNNSGVITALNVMVSSDNPEFAVSGFTNGSTIAAGGTATYNVIFEPTTAGAKTATITVSSTTTNDVTSDLTGTGLAVVNQAVTSNAATAIAGTTATLNGNVTALGTCPNTTEKGFVYSVTSLNANPLFGGANVNDLDVAGLITGAYNLGLTGLTPGTQYSFKAYVYDGTTYTYGNVLTFTTTPTCTAPSGQPTNLILSNITGSSIDGLFTATSADEYLVVVSTSNTLSGNPVNGTTYNNGDPLGGGTVVQSSNATTFTASGLFQTTPYYFFVFALNNSGCVGAPAYNIANPLTGNDTTITGPCLTTGFENADSWVNHSGGNWTEITPDGDYISNGCYADAGDTNNGIRKVGLNDVGDWLELPPVDNPTSLTYYARLSSAPSATNSLTIQYYNGSSWIDIVVHTATSTTYELFTADLSSITVLTNVRLRLYRSAHNRSHYIDDLSVYCGTPINGPELQLVNESNAYESCGYTIDFGNVSTDMTSDITFDILNLGNQPLNITSFNITGDFAINPSTATSVTTGDSEAFTISFSPQSIGTLNGQLTITSDDTDENSCIINLTGIGFAGVEEIRVETNSGNNIPDGAGIAPAYNNTFAATTEGQSSAPKTYLIINEGTGDLDLNNITISTTEFTITGNPANTTLTPTDSAPLSIVFNPSSAGVKNATVTINNTDGDENPFTFAIRGTGLCGSSTMTTSPNSGPIGTIITITDLSANISTATVTLNGTPLTPTVISNNEIEVTVPNGAQTGNLIVTNASGCVSTFLFNVIDNQIGGCEGGTTLGELFISEVTDATYGGLSYVELYNATGIAVDLSTYTLDLYQNGNTDPFDPYEYKTQALSGTIGVNQTFVIAIGNDIYDCPQAGADGSYADLEITGIGGINKPVNGHDYLALLNSGTTVDEFGEFGDNNWMDNVHTTISGTKGFDFRRLNTASPLPNDSFDDNQWLIIDWAGSGNGSCTTNDYSDIGSFDFSTGAPPTLASGPTISYSCNTATINVTGTEGYNALGDTQELAYQWYYSAPGDSGWTEVPNTAAYDYASTTTNTLNILDTSTLEKYQFYCQVREDDQDCYEASDAIQLTLPTTTWTGTWSSPPTNGKIAIIAADYNTGNGTGGQTSFDACSLIINANYTLTVSNTTYVNVVNNVTNYGTIDIQTQGSFVQQGDGAAAGTFTNSGAGIANVAKTTALFDSSISEINYTYWSSPINNPNNSGYGELISDVFPTPVGNRRYYFMAQNYIDTYKEDTNDNDNTTLGQDDIDDNANDWQVASGAMEIGRGYAVTASGLPPSPGPFRDASTVFSGALNTGDITVTLYKNNNEVDDNNWNFIGNPYPSAIDVDLFFNANIADVPLNPPIGGETEGAIFLWSQSVAPDANNNGNENVNFAQSDYAIINRVTEIAGTSGIIPDPFIPSGQGFFVALTENLGTPVNSVTSANIVFTNSMRTTGSNTQFFEANDGSHDLKTLDTNYVFEKNILWLNLTSDNGVFSQIAVAYANGATDGYDGWSYDTPRNLSTGTYASLYSLIDSKEEQFAIQGKSPQSLNLNEIIPIGFDTSINEATLYRFSIAQLEGSFMSQNDIFIKDNLLNKMHNLKESDYSFTSEVGDFNDRFEIVFTRETLNINEEKPDSNSLQIIELPNGDVQFKVSSQFEMKSIEIVDLLGRTLYKLNAEGNSQTYALSNLSQATYLAKVELTNGYVITKKALKRK